MVPRTAGTGAKSNMGHQEHAISLIFFPSMGRADIACVPESLMSRFLVQLYLPALMSGASSLLSSRCRRGRRLLPGPVNPAALCDRQLIARVSHDARDQKAIYSQRKVIISSCAECQFPAQHVTVICQGVWASPGRLWWHNWRGYSRRLVTSPPLNSFNLCVMSW